MERPPGQRLFEALGDAAAALALDQVADLRAGDDDEVVALRQPVGEAPEGLAQRPLDLVALDRAADLAADRDAEPHVFALLVAAGEGVEDEVAGRMG